jgi:hypothetical protein
LYLVLPEREFIVYRGSISSLLTPDGGPIVVAPSLLWADDRSWYLNSEFDLDSTLLGGSEELVKAVAESPDLETAIVLPSDSMGQGADQLNLPG